MRDRIERALAAAVAEVNRSRASGAQIPGDGVLFGPGGALDSLGLVNFAITAEEHLEQAIGVEVPLVAAIGTDDAPFGSWSSLIAFVERALGEAAGRGG